MIPNKGFFLHINKAQLRAGQLQLPEVAQSAVVDLPLGCGQVMVNNHSVASCVAVQDSSRLTLVYGVAFRQKNKAIPEGDYCQIELDAAAQRISISSNPINSRPFYFYEDEHSFYAATSIYELAHVLRQKGDQPALDVAAAYSLLAFGYIVQPGSLLQDIQRSAPGETITLDRSGQVQRSYYHRFEYDIKQQESEQSHINQLDQLFRRAVRRGFDFDRQQGRRHLLTISGGLDSRVVLLTARQEGYDNIAAVTFSESNHLEFKIAQQVGIEYATSFLYYSLSRGHHLCNIEEPMRYNSGSSAFSGAAHTLSMMKLLRTESFGLIHTGQLGDAVLGTYLAGASHAAPTLANTLPAHPLAQKIMPDLQAALQAYETQELFKLHKRGFNHIFNGYRMMEPFMEFYSAFMDTDFIQKTLNIPAKLKYRRAIYLKWIAQRIPEATHYPTANYALRPKAKYTRMPWLLLPLAFKAYKLGRQKLSKRYAVSMNPVDKWMQENPAIRPYFDRYFEEHLQLLSPYPELQQDAQRQYQNGPVLERTKVLSLLAFLRLIQEAPSTETTHL